MPSEKYGAILDAGSSGTRIHIYRWEDHHSAQKTASKEQLSGLPEIITKKKWIKKIHPGISTFAENPDLVGPEHLSELFSHALDIIPPSSISETPLFLLATAGMRLLPDRERTALLDAICTYARRTTEFLLPDCGLHIQVISGETEGLYGWIAANYLLGGFNEPEKHAHGGGHHTYGFLDMGGASAQIAFAPNATEARGHARDLTMLRMRSLDGAAMEFAVFVTTWLGFGVHQARLRYVDRLVEASGGDGVMELPDPCLPRGLKVSLEDGEVEDKVPHLVGTGLFEECLSQTYPLLATDVPCGQISCLLTSKHAPAIDFDINHFVGVSEYWHTTHEIFSPHETKYDPTTYQSRVSDFCAQTWSAISGLIDTHEWGKVDASTAMQVCFKASWIINVLHNGIGIPRTKHTHNTTDPTTTPLDPFQPVNKIHDVEVSWTLGKIVLYAASQVPPKDDTVLAVGFGPNAPAADFELASAPQSGSPPVASNYTITDPHWHDNLWREGDSVPRRVPGLLLFLIIFAIAAFLLLGRERRSRIWHSLRVSGKKGKRKILGSGGGVVYERVVEEGAFEVELGGVSSDEDDMGWRNKSGFYDGGASAVRSGLGTRIRSRERLPVVSWSRNGSPSRGARARSPLPPR